MKSLLSFNRRGQSLVEVIVACGILAVIMAAIMSIVIASKNLLYQSEEQTRATTLAREGIEIARHQKDVGCTFDNITENGDLSSNVWYIKGDTDSTYDETLQTSGIPDQIGGYEGFSRRIVIEKLDINTSNIGIAGFETDMAKCSSPEDDFDCLNKYYAVRAEVHKGDLGGPIISEAKTIISK